MTTARSVFAIPLVTGDNSKLPTTTQLNSFTEQTRPDPVLPWLQVLSCTAVPNTILAASSVSHSVSTTGKRKQPDSDPSEARGSNSGSADVMLSDTEPKQASWPQSQHAEHDQQLPQQLPKQEPQPNPLQQHRHSQGSCELELGDTVPSQGSASVWGHELGRVVAWCFSQVVEKHLLAELQVGPRLDKRHAVIVYLCAQYLLHH